jgi:hypothetical protein
MSASSSKMMGASNSRMKKYVVESSSSSSSSTMLIAPKRDVAEIVLEEGEVSDSSSDVGVVDVVDEAAQLPLPDPTPKPTSMPIPQPIAHKPIHNPATKPIPSLKDITPPLKVKIPIFPPLRIQTRPDKPTATTVSSLPPIPRLIIPRQAFPVVGAVDVVNQQPCSSSQVSSLDEGKRALIQKWVADLPTGNSGSDVVGLIEKLVAVKGWLD